MTYYKEKGNEPIKQLRSQRKQIMEDTAKS